MNVNTTILKPLDLVGALYMDKALCRPKVRPEGVTWFSERGDSTPVVEAKKVCMRCPVRERCLDYAVKHNERFRVWGGTTPEERKAIRRAAGLTVERTGEECPSYGATRRHYERGEKVCDVCLAWRRKKDAARRANGAHAA